MDIINAIINAKSIEELKSIADYEEIKNTIEENLKTNIAEESWESLFTLSREINHGNFDPYNRFEETKIKNFRSSSILEGIKIDTNDESATLESILLKYKKEK